jgi:hypothetical protein
MAMMMKPQVHVSVAVMFPLSCAVLRQIRQLAYLRTIRCEPITVWGVRQCSMANSGQGQFIN